MTLYNMHVCDSEGEKRVYCKMIIKTIMLCSKCNIYCSISTDSKSKPWVFSMSYLHLFSIITSLNSVMSLFQNMYINENVIYKHIIVIW